MAINEFFSANLNIKDFKKCGLEKDWIITSVAEAWSKCYYHEPTTKSEVLNQTLWCNSHIRDKRGPLVNQAMLNQGTTEIRHIFNQEEGKFFEYVELKQSYGNIGNFLQYHKLVQCIPPNWKSRLKTKGKVTESFDVRSIVDKYDKVASKMYWFLIGKEKHYDHGRITWQTELKTYLDMDRWKAIQLHAFKITLSTNHRLFQFKLLSNKITTNVLRHRWDRTISDRCFFCTQKAETTLHLFWECDIVQAFWQKIIKWMDYICKVKCSLIITMVILNQSRDEHSALIDMIVLLAKQYIYATKCLGEKLNVRAFLGKIHRMYIIEKEIAFQTNKVKNFRKKWVKYENNI